MSEHGRNIADRSPEFESDHALRASCLVLAEGLEALKRDAGGASRWTWPAKGEMELLESGGKKLKTAYQTKIDGARLDNVWRESLSATAATPFTAVPTVDGWPASMASFDESVDDQGRDLLTFWADVFWMKLVSGIHYILVDMPTEIGGRAYWISLPAGNILGVKVALVNGRIRLLEVRIALRAETEQSPGNKFGSDPDSWPETVTETVIRIYRVAEFVPGVEPNGPVYFRESAKRDMGSEKKWVWISDWIPLLANGGVFTEIPLYPLYGSRTVGPYRGRPDFLDTASLQMSLWRKIIDYDARERKDSKNIIAISGAQPGDITGDSNTIYLPEGATASLLETTGASLEALRTSHAEIRQSIRIGNHRPILSQPTPSRTATEILAYHLSASSELEMSVIMDLHTLRMALTAVALLNGEDPGKGTVDIPHDYTLFPGAMSEIWKGYIESKGVLVPPRLAWVEASHHQWISASEDPLAIAKEVEGNLALLRGSNDESTELNSEDDGGEAIDGPE